MEDSKLKKITVSFTLNDMKKFEKQKNENIFEEEIKIMTWRWCWILKR